MKGLWSDHFPPAAEKPRETFSPCKTEGLWSEIFPPAEKSTPPPPPPPLPRFERCLPCRTCYAAIPVKTSSGRQFYTCPAPAKDHKFFKWADMVKPDELMDVPYCGCEAGVCRVRKETTGPNAGRILFMCNVKKGDGACGYEVWKDELERACLFGSRMCNGGDTSPGYIDEVADNGSPVIDNSRHLGVTSAEMKQVQCDKQLKVVEEDISATMDWEIEAELLCSKVELRTMEQEIAQILEKEVVLEGNHLIASKEFEECEKLLKQKEAELSAASKELEECRKLRKQKEAERNAAKVAFDRKRALLRVTI